AETKYVAPDALVLALPVFHEGEHPGVAVGLELGPADGAVADGNQMFCGSCRVNGRSRQNCARKCEFAEHVSISRAAVMTRAREMKSAVRQTRAAARRRTSPASPATARSQPAGW